jgi:hypothetical protein
MSPAGIEPTFKVYETLVFEGDQKKLTHHITGGESAPCVVILSSLNPGVQILFFPMEQDPVHQLVLRALRGSEVVVTNLATIPKAIEKGERISVTLPLSDEAAINKLFEQCRERALALASKLLPCPISDTPILYLYDQIRLCILFNLNGAAIIFCGILVEYALKYTTYAKENAGVPNFESSDWEAFEEITLVPAIVRARKAGLIDEKHEKSLRSFAKDLRNKYSHFNIQKITKDAVFEQVRERDIETGEEKIVSLPASTSPAFQIIAKDILDEKKVVKVFEYADSVVRHLFAMLSTG